MSTLPPPLYPLPGSSPITRRSFVLGSASFAAAALLSTRARGAVSRAAGFPAYPFSLGVASGDPAADGFVIWTRLAPTPLVPGGGMGREPVEVRWEVAADEGMRRVVQSGRAVANAEWAHSVHVEVEGLAPDRWYWYRFHVSGEISPVGRARTFPAAGTRPDRLRFAFASCQKYETGYYTALEHLAREDVDLILHLGDYIYEKGPDASAVRQHNSPEIMTLEDYRARYALYKSDPALQAAHAIAPWLVTWDDHEVSNNYANDIHEKPETNARADFLLRRAAGYQAYFEHMPLRRSAQPKGPDMSLYRRLAFGDLAAFNVLDTRQYRTDQPQGDGSKPFAPELLNPAGSMLGATQRNWLLDGLSSSRTDWNVLAQQVMMAPAGRSTNGGPLLYSMDKWPGYEFERRLLLRELRDRRVGNPVVLTGDIHTNWANELLVDFERPGESKAVAAEFVGTSITSGGDGAAEPAGTAEMMSANPWVKYFNSQRGYVRCEVTPAQWRTEYRVLPYVTRPGAPVSTARTYVLESGHPQLNRA